MASLILILKITGLSNLAPKELGANANEVIGGGGKVDHRNPSKKSKNDKYWLYTFRVQLQLPSSDIV